MKKEDKNKQKNVGHYHDTNTKNPLHNLNNLNNITEIRRNLPKNVGQILDDHPKIMSVYLPPSLVAEVKRFILQDSVELGISPPSFSGFLRLLLINYVLSHYKKEEVKEQEEPRITCFICGQEATCFLIHPKSEKSYPVCKRHRKSCLERGWLPVEKEIMEEEH